MNEPRDHSQPVGMDSEITRSLSGGRPGEAGCGAPVLPSAAAGGQISSLQAPAPPTHEWADEHEAEHAGDEGQEGEQEDAGHEGSGGQAADVTKSLHLDKRQSINARGTEYDPHGDGNFLNDHI